MVRGFRFVGPPAFWCLLRDITILVCVSVYMVQLTREYGSTTNPGVRAGD
jgi:hypothetical protein